MGREMNPRSKRRVLGARVERGSVLAVSTLGMLSVLLIAGMCIDISHLYMAKVELQDAADAAALAAASQLNSSSGGIKLAVAEATKVLNKYDVKQDVTIPSSAVTFSVNLNGTYIKEANAYGNSSNIRFVKVEIPPKPVGISLSALVLGQTQSLGATAIAGMSVALTMNKFYTAMIFIEPNADEDSGCGSESSGSGPAIFELGKKYTLSPKQWQSPDAGSYRVLAGTGGDLILTGTIHAYGYATGSYQAAKLSAADDCRIARIGVNTRFGDYSWHPGSNATDEPPDTIIKENLDYTAYTQLQGNGIVDRADGVRNRRIITIPIASTGDYNVTTGSVTANRIGAFFLRSEMDTSCNLDVEYIGDHLTVPVGEYRPGSIQLNELSIPVIYR